MPTILSDADVFGQTAPPATPPPDAGLPAGGSFLSDDDVFGTPKPLAKSPSASRQPRSDASIMLGGAAAGAKAVARTVSDFGDMLLSIPGMAVGTAADVASRVQSLAEGTDPRAAGRIAKQVREGVTSDFSPTVLRQLTEKAINAVAPDKKSLTPTDVQNGMEVISQGLERGGKWVEQKTGGVITAETFDSLVNEGMALGGLKGSAEGAKRFVPKEKAPMITPEPAPEPKTPAAAAAMRDVKADIEASTGVSQAEPQGKAALAAQEARRTQARLAFKEDPQYADYLRNYAEEEARLRSLEPPPVETPGSGPDTGVRTPRTGLRDAVEEPSLPPANPPAIETGAPNALDSALDKVRQGRGFDLTAEERILLRNSGPTPELELPPNRPNGPRGQRGSGSTKDMTTLAVAAGGALGLYAANSALGPLLRNSDYTLKTLERLPQNRTEFTREQVMQQLNRADVSKAEKELVQSAVGDKQTISAKELVQAFKDKGRDLELYPKKTDEYADYGIENLGRRPDDGGFTRDTVPSETTIYRSPHELGDSNHFGDPNYFAHTRSFEEGGVRHVVEIQSDVAQHAKQISPEVRAEAQKNYDVLNKLASGAEAVQIAFNSVKSTIPDYLEALKKYEAKVDSDVSFDVKHRLGEKIWGRLAESVMDNPLDSWAESAANRGDFDVVYDQAKAFLERADEMSQKRAKRGEPNDFTYVNKVANAFENAFYEEAKTLDRRALEQQARLRGAVPKEIKPLLKSWYKRIIREELADAPANQPVRFATADTVAKVEGWPRNDYWARQAEGFAERMRNEPDPRARENLQGELAAARELEQRQQGREGFSPEHQSIYDRYRTDIEKFLKTDLGAKPYTDEKGHTWLEVPPAPKGPKRMLGRTTTSDVAALAAFVGGAAAMHAWSDDPGLVKDIVAGLFASAATRLRPRALASTLRSIRNAKPLESIDKIAVEREANIRLAGLDTANTVREVAKLVPDEKRREAVHEALDTGVARKLSPPEYKAYEILKGEYARLGQIGLDAETLKATRANYATHMWKMDADIFERLFGRRQGFGTSPNTPYAMHRAFETMKEGEAAGLTPVSKDAAFVFATYANSLVSAIENSKMLKTLRTAKTEGGDLLVQKTADAPPQYVTIQNPQMRGLAVHPEIAPQMRFIFENPSAAGVGAALEIIADVTKRSAVSASLFHAKALVDVLVAAVPGKGEYFGKAALGAAAGYAAATTFDDEHALRDAALAGLAGYVGPRLKAYATGRNAFLDEVRKGSSSAFVTRAVKSGLVFGAEKGPLVVDDAGRRFYDAMRVVQREADRITQPVGIKGGKGVEVYIKANHWMDDMLWGRLHPAMKLEVWSKTSDTLRQASIDRNARNPATRVLSQAEADAIASKYTNDMFGGLNWTRIAMEAQTKLGRVVAQELLSPRGRRALRIGMFAPDWTISTARAALAAVDKDLVNPLKWGNVAKGMFQPISRGDLARQYVARSALYYLVVGDAINYSMSGHHLWENDDKTGWSFIDWGDGRKMQFSKHIMETPHWFDHPVKQAIGKLGYVPKEIANQALGTEYIAPQSGKGGQVYAGPKMKDPSLVGRVGHALGGLTPIPFQGEPNDASAWGFVGMPIYGKTREQLDQLRRDREDAKRRAR